MRAHRLVCVLWCLACTAPTAAQVRPGIDVLLSDSVHLVRGKRLGLLTNHTGMDGQGRRDVDALRAGGQRLTALFSPEHGFRGTDDRSGLPDGTDSATGLPIYSLYGGSRPAARAALDSLDVLLIDLQDIGARYYTYISTAVSLMRDAARAGKRTVVLDRPNPIGGRDVQGQVRARIGDPDSAFVGFLPVAMRHGMTLGEMARMANDLLGIGADLVVVPAAGWKRGTLYDRTGLTWVKPSPNMPSLASALLYPGLCLFEGTNVSVGRGTPLAFQLLGAPWIDPQAVLEKLFEPPEDWRHARGSAVTGVDIRVLRFVPEGPTDGKYDGQTVQGLRVDVVNPREFDPTKLAIALIAAIRAAHPRNFEFRPESFDRLAGGPELRRALEGGREPWQIWAGWEPGLAQFRRERAKYLLY